MKIKTVISKYFYIGHETGTDSLNDVSCHCHCSVVATLAVILAFYFHQMTFPIAVVL